MDSKLMNKILKEKKIKISEIPDDLDIENLPGDVEIILDEDFPDLEDDFWEEDEQIPPLDMFNALFPETSKEMDERIRRVIK